MEDFKERIYIAEVDLDKYGYLGRNRMQGAEVFECPRGAEDKLCVREGRAARGTRGRMRFRFVFVFGQFI